MTEELMETIKKRIVAGEAEFEEHKKRLEAIRAAVPNIETRMAQIAGALAELREIVRLSQPLPPQEPPK